MTTIRNNDDWAKFLAERFNGTEYEAKPAEYWGWCAAGVDEDDDEEDVAAAWIEGCEQSRRALSQ